MNKAPEQEDASKQKTDEQLNKELQEFTAERDALAQRIRDMMLAERPAEGLVYAGELHEARQEKLRLDAEILYREQVLRRRSFAAGPLQ